MKVAFYTLGCRTNQFETQAMEKLFVSNGCELVPFESDADIYIINSCSVTASSDSKTRHIINRVRREHPNAVIGLCGCMAQLTMPGLEKKLGVDILGGNRNHIEFTNAVMNFAEKNLPAENTGRIDESFVVLPAGGLSQRTRSFLKIEDGCNYFCSYCIIPYARGRVRSISPEIAVQQAKELAEQGYSEIVVTGIEISAYGEDIGYQGGLTELIKNLCEAVYPARISLGSLHPTVITEEFCRKLSGCRNLCRHFHLSLQSCSDTVLKRMHRHYDTDIIRNAITLLRNYFEEPNICADIIGGFCGETEEEHRSSLEFLKEMKMSGLHVFPYSERKGTFASRNLSDDVEKATKDLRCSQITEISERNRKDYLENQLGKVFTVIFETRESEDVIGGYSEYYIYIKVKDHLIRKGEIRKVKATGINKNGFWGEIVQ